MDIKIYSHNEKKDLVKKIERLTSKAHYRQVYKLLKLSGIKITQNNNGVFFNMNDLTNEILLKLDNFLDSVLNKVNASIDMKYYNDVIMNTTTQSEGTMNKNIIDYNNDSYINEIHDENDDNNEEVEEEEEKVQKKEDQVIKKETSKK
jgi:spermidine synthase